MFGRVDICMYVSHSEKSCNKKAAVITFSQCAEKQKIMYKDMYTDCSKGSFVDAGSIDEVGIEIYRSLSRTRGGCCGRRKEVGK